MKFTSCLALYWAILSLSGCVATRPLVSREAATPAETGAALKKADDSFISFDNEKRYSVKVRQKPFLDILDLLFYNKRLSYTFSTDVPNTVFTVSGAGSGAAEDWQHAPARNFRSMGEVLAYLLDDELVGVNSGLAESYPELDKENVDRPHDLARSVLRGRDPLSLAMMASDRKLLERVMAYRNNAEVPEPVRLELAAVLNKFIAGPSAPELFKGYVSEQSYRSLQNVAASRGSDPATPRKLNRFLLEQLYGEDLNVQRRLKYRFLADGVEFYRDRDPFYPSENSAFKKVFLYHITCAEAMDKLAKLYPGTGGVGAGDLPAVKQADPGKYILIPLEAQNALVVNADRDQVERVGQTLFALDAKYNTVLVETKVFEYSDSVGMKLGAAIDYSRQFGNQKIGVSTFFLDSLKQPASGNVFPIWSYGVTNLEKKLNLLTQLLYYGQDGLVKITAEPRLVLKPGATADVSLKSTKYILTNPSVAGSGDLKTIEAGTALKITPTILGSDKILLEVTLEQSEFIPSAGEANVVQVSNNNHVKSTLVVNDGELISIGGIKTLKSTSTHSGIPYLKDIPYLGALFGSIDNNSQVVNIEFMIRPTINYTKAVNAGVVNDIDRYDRALTEKMGMKDGIPVQGTVVREPGAPPAR